MAAASAVLKERDAGAFAFLWIAAANYGTGSGLINCTLLAGAEPVHRSLSPKPFLKRAGLILLTEIDADIGGR